jgi:hypothetical protein
MAEPISKQSPVTKESLLKQLSEIETTLHALAGKPGVNPFFLLRRHDVVKNLIPKAASLDDAAKEVTAIASEADKLKALVPSPSVPTKK